MPTLITYFSFLVVLSFLLHENLLVRCVCLQDVFAFYYSRKACEFSLEYFNSTIPDIRKRSFCTYQCYIVSIEPELVKYKLYEIEQLTVLFPARNRIIWNRPCGMYANTDIYLTVNCEGTYVYERDIGERCIEHEQCKAVNTNSTCNSTNCVCQEGYLWNSKTCLKARGLDRQCTETRQCQAINPDSRCDINNNVCECRHGFIQHNNSCEPTRKLDERCSYPIQCSETTQNSTCNETTNICQCKDGYLRVLNRCTKGRLLLGEMCDSYVHSGISDDEQTDIENVCSTYFGPGFDSSGEISQNRYIGTIVVVGLAGVLFGIVLCSFVFFFLIRRIKESKKRFEMNKLESTGVQMQRVQVSGDMKSRPIVRTKKSDDTEENGIYNHLHENPIELLEVQSDYDHCPSQTATEDMYSHLASGYDNSDNYLGDYGEIN